MEQTYKGHNTPVYTLCITSNDQYIYSSGQDKLIRCHHVQNGEEILPLFEQRHNNTVFDICIDSKDTFLFTSSQDKTIIKWNIETKEVMNILKGHTHWIYKLSISSDDQFLISGSFDKTFTQ